MKFYNDRAECRPKLHVYIDEHKLGPSISEVYYLAMAHPDLSFNHMLLHHLHILVLLCKSMPGLATEFRVEPAHPWPRRTQGCSGKIPRVAKNSGIKYWKAGFGFVRPPRGAKAFGWFGRASPPCRHPT